MAVEFNDVRRNSPDAIVDSLAVHTGESITELYLTLLGGFRVHRDGITVPDSAWRQRRTGKTLIKLLATVPDHTLHREQILEMLWPDVKPDSSLNSLGKALHAARYALEPDLQPRASSSYLNLTSDFLTLDVTHLRIDADRFQDLAESALRQDDIHICQEALKAYTGELLPEDRYEDWSSARREMLASLHVQLLLKLADAFDARGAHKQVVSYLRRVLEQDPTREDVHRRLIRIFGELGSRHEALRQYQICRNVLERELDAEPEPETEELYQDILANRVHKRMPALDLDSTELTSHPLATMWNSLSTPLIGRDRVLQRLVGELTRAESGDGGMVLVSGEAGVGKSRLVAELVHRAAERGVLVLWGANSPNESLLPYSPFVMALEGYVAGRPASERRELAQRYPDLIRLIPSLETDGHFPSWVDSSDADRTHLFPSIVRFLTDLASTRVVLLVLGDLDSTDSSSLQLLQYLARLAIKRHWLLVGTYREEDLATGSELQSLLSSMMRERFSRHIELRCLAQQDCAELVKALFPDGEPDAALVEQVCSLSLGNPLFVEELIRTMRERHELACEDGKWHMLTSEPAHLPRQVENLVQMNMSRMEEHVRQILSLAATAGMQFRFDELRRGAGALHPPISESELFDALDRGLQARILEEHEDGYAFRHPLFRVALYEQLSKHRRAHLEAALRSHTERRKNPDSRGTAARSADYADMTPSGGNNVEVRRVNSLHPKQAAEAYGELVDHLDRLGRMVESARVRQKLAAVLIGMAKYSRALRVLEQASDLYEAEGEVEGLAQVAAEIDLVMSLQGEQAGSDLTSKLASRLMDSA